MSEPTQKPDQQAQSIDAERLKRQAEQLRQEGYRPVPLMTGPSRAAQIIYIVMLALIVAVALFLLISGNSRTRLIRAIARAWGNIYTTEQKVEVYKLPPAPPKAVEPRVVLQGSPTYAYPPPPSRAVQSGEEASAPGEAEEEAPGAETASKPPAPPEKTAAANSAYDFLIKKSDVARRLSSNNFPDYHFKEWRPLRNAPPEFWVDLIAVKSGGPEVHFVWVVNPETGTVVPKSQDARDLERK